MKSATPTHLQFGPSPDDGQASVERLRDLAAIIDPVPERVATVVRLAFAAARQPAWRPEGGRPALPAEG